MDYSQLVTAIREEDSSKASELIKAFTPRLTSFLLIHMKADKNIAEDCAQETFLITIETIRKGKLRYPESITTFMLSTCRNTYLKMQNKRREQLFQDVPTDGGYVAPQFDELVEKERMNILEWCIKRLTRSYREFIRFWLEHPEQQAEVVADHFDITVNSAWTRKHRILKKLNECYQKKNKF